MRSAECGMRNIRTGTPPFRTPHSALRTPHSPSASSPPASPPPARNAEQILLAARAERALAVSPEEVSRSLSGPDQERYRACQGRLRALEAQRPAPLPVAMGLSDGAKPVPTYLLERGEFE